MKNDDPIIFKILQADSDALQYLGFAKKQARHLAENDVEVCTRTWDMGDATVEVQYLPSTGFKIAKIKLIGGGLIPYYYADFLYLPCKGRELDLVVSIPLKPTLYVRLGTLVPGTVTFGGVFNGYTTGVYTSWDYVGTDNVVYGSGQGTYASDGTYLHCIRAFIDFGYLGAQSFATTLSSHYITGLGQAYSVESPINQDFSYTAAQVALDAAYVAVSATHEGLRTRIILDDGTQLASQPLIINPTTLVDYAFVRNWSGGDSVQLFNVEADLYVYTPPVTLQFLDLGPGNFTPGTTLKFVVPPDVVYPPQPDTPPRYPNGVSYPLLNMTVLQAISFPYLTVAQWGYSDGTQSASGSDLYTSTYVVVGGRGTVVHTYTNFPTSYGGAPCFMNGQQGVDIVDGQIVKNIDTRVYTLDPHYQAQLSALAAIINQWNTDWAAGRAVAATRERVRLKLCSDILKAQLGALLLPGAAPLPVPLPGDPLPPPLLMPEVVLAKLRRNHPVSSKTKMKQVMKTDTPADTITYPSDDQSVRTRSVTLSYTKKDKDGIVTNPSQTITGTRITTQTRHIDSQGFFDEQVRSLKIEYKNYPLIETQAGSIKENLGILYKDDSLNDFRLDYNTGFAANGISAQYVLSRGDPIALVLNGTVTFGAQSRGYLAIAAYSVLGIIDGVSRYIGPFSHDTYNQYNNTFDRYGGNFTPSFPRSGQTITYSHPTIYTDYRLDINRTYDGTGGNQDWLDSAFIDGELVDIFPVSTVHNTLGDLGMFPYSSSFYNNITEPILLTSKIDMKATYKYTYLTGAWTFVSVTMLDGKTNPDKTVNKPPVMLPYQAQNMIFRSRVKVKDEWPDVAIKYRAQAADIAANPTVNLDSFISNNPVFFALQKL